MCIFMLSTSLLWTDNQCEPDYFSSLLRGQVIDCDVIDLHELVARDEPAICRTTCTHKNVLVLSYFRESHGPLSVHSALMRRSSLCSAVLCWSNFHLTPMHKVSPNQSLQEQNPISVNTVALLSLFALCHLPLHQCLGPALHCLLFSLFNTALINT